MVESIHTFVADVAVAASISADCLAFWTERIGVESFNDVEEVNLWIFLYIAWISKPRQEEEEN